MKSNAIIRIVLFSIAIILLLAILFGCIALVQFGRSAFNGFGWNVGTVFPKLDDAKVGSGSVDASLIHSVEIRWVSGSVTIVPGETNAILFSEQGNTNNANQMVWKQSGDKLILQFAQENSIFNWSFFNSNSVNKDLVVTIPIGWSGSEVKITSVSANVDVTDMSADKIKLENVSGRCTMRNCTAKQMDVETVSGNVEYSGSVNDLDCETVSGDCKVTISHGSANSANFDSVSGDLTLELPENYGFRAEIDSVSGNISSEFQTTVVKGTHIYGTGSYQIDANTVSGDVIIKINHSSSIPYPTVFPETF